MELLRYRFVTPRMRRDAGDTRLASVGVSTAEKWDEMREDCIDICVVEDDQSQRDVLVARLESRNYTVCSADTGRTGLELVYEHRPKILICDIVLPDLNGIQVCRQVRADPTLDGVYIVLVTAYDQSDQKYRALNAGADEYLQKPYDIEELRARIRNGLRHNRLKERLERAALTDGLTGLWNHTQFRDLLDKEFMRARRYGGRVSLVMIDLDHFKAVNDTFGHEAGNAVLKAVAQHLRQTARETDTVARYGGEEFAIICPEASLDDAALLAERIRSSLPKRVHVRGRPDAIVRASLGVAGSEDTRVNSVTDLITVCDQALYHSKHNGRSRVTRCDELTDDGPVEPEVRADMVDRLRKEIVALSMRSKDLSLQSIWALIQALEARDGYSAWHSRNVMLYANWLADAAGWERPLKLATAHAAMLHDLGKIGIPDKLLVHPSELNAEEAVTLRQVPLITCKILEPLRVFETEVLIIRHLRERFDGAGYPDGLKGDQIPIGSRLLAIAEAFDSITCNRAYRLGRSLDEALGVFREESGRQFDPMFVTLLDQLVSEDRDRWESQISRARIELPGLTLEGAGVHPR